MQAGDLVSRGITADVEEKGWCSADSARLPLMWFRFDPAHLSKAKIIQNVLGAQTLILVKASHLRVNHMWHALSLSINELFLLLSHAECDPAFWIAS